MSRGIYVFIIGLIWIVYAYATIAKFYPDWLDGSFPRYLMSTRGKNWDILQYEWAHEAIKYFGLTFDLLIVPFLLWKRTRWFAVAASVFFHLFNSVVFKIGIFPYMALSFLPSSVQKTSSLKVQCFKGSSNITVSNIVTEARNKLRCRAKTISPLLVNGFFYTNH